LQDKTMEASEFGALVTYQYEHLSEYMTPDEIANGEEAIIDDVEYTQRLNLFNLIWRSIDELRSLVFAGIENGPDTQGRWR